MQANPSVLEAALEYERLGFSVIPVQSIVNGHCTCRKQDCQSPGKHPVGSWKQYQIRRRTADDVRDCWLRLPFANVGIVTGAISNLIVLDIDDMTALDGFPELQLAVDAQTGPAATTGRTTGGRHLYYRHPGEPLGNFARKLQGIDGRADGGFVVAAPSIHASGRSYAWEQGRSCATLLTEAPPEVLGLFQKTITAQVKARPFKPGTPYGQTALGEELARVAGAAEGGRNHALNSAAFSLEQLCQTGHLDRGEVEGQLMAAAGVAGLKDSEAQATIRSGRNGAVSKPRSVAASGGSVEATVFEANFQALDLWPIQNNPLAPPEFPAHVLGSTWSEWVRGNAASAGAPPAYVGLALLVAAAGLIGNARRVTHGAWEEPAILWGMMVGDPSTGKTPALRPVDKLASIFDRDIAVTYPAAKAAHEAK